MPVTPARTRVIVLPLCAIALLVAACTKDNGSSGSQASPGHTAKVGITDAGCDPAALTVPAGPTTFVVTNKGTSAVTEYEVKDGEKIIGEKENLTPGLSGSFSIDLKPGDYTLKCPGGTTPEGTLHVTGEGSAALGADAAKAVGDYRAYLESETDKLVADVERLQGLVKTVDLQPAQIANGASELLDEVSTSKITGEEDRYSHADLRDFEANVQGSFEAFRMLQRLVARTDPSVVAEIENRHGELQRALAKYRTGDGYVSYTSLTGKDVRSLARAVDALAEPMSRVGALVVNTSA